MGGGREERQGWTDEMRGQNKRHRGREKEVKKGWRVRKGRRVNEKAGGGRRVQWREEEEEEG